MARAQPTPIVALAGSTAYGIALFSYFVNRSADHILPYVSLPALMVASLWLTSRCGRGSAIGRRRCAGAALGGAAAVAVL